MTCSATSLRLSCIMREKPTPTAIAMKCCQCKKGLITRQGPDFSEKTAAGYIYLPGPGHGHKPAGAYEKSVRLFHMAVSRYRPIKPEGYLSCSAIIRLNMVPSRCRHGARCNMAMVVRLPREIKARWLYPFACTLCILLTFIITVSRVISHWIFRRSGVQLTVEGRAGESRW
jgi:hypothetical protein